MLRTGPSVFERRWFWFLLVALIVRAVFILWKVSDVRPTTGPGLWYFETPDTHSYFNPIESLLKGGEYDPDYRMPGVGAPYLLFRLFLGPVGGRDAMVVLQWMLSGLSVLLLTLLGVRLTGSARAGWAVYILFLLSTFSSWYDTSMSSDSLASSILVIQAYLFQRGLDSKDPRLLMAAGFFLGWAVFLRPVAALLFAPALLMLHLYQEKPRTIRMYAIFLLPFALMESYWVIRNWRVNQEFNPLTNQGMMPDEIADRPLGYLMRFLQGYGGDYIWWQPNADIRWFGLWHGAAEVDDEGRNAPPPPPRAYAPGYTKDSLMTVSALIRSALDGDLTPSDSAAAIAKANAALERYTAIHAASAPWTHHVTSRFLMVRHQVLQNGAETLFARPFSTLPLWMKLFKLLQMILYPFAFLVGSIAAIVSIIKWRGSAPMLQVWLSIMLMYMVLIYPLGLKMAEWRFMVHVFPIALLLATCFTVDRLSIFRGPASDA